MASTYNLENKKFNEWIAKGGKIDLKVLLAIFAITGVKASTIGITDEMLMGRQTLDVFNELDERLGLIQEEQSEFISYGQFRRTDRYPSFSEYYFEKLKLKIEVSSDRIFVYDYLVNSWQLLSDKDKLNYYKGYDKYFETIITKGKEKDKNIFYRRIVALPIGLDGLYDFEEIDLTDDLHKGVFLFSNEFFSHLLKSFEHFGDRFMLTISNSPSRLFSVMILDKKYIASEYYRIKRKGDNGYIMIPNMMFIDTVQNENQFTVLMNTYENEFLGISQERIRLRELLGIINTIIHKITSYLNSLTSQDVNVDDIGFEAAKKIRRVEDLLETFQKKKNRIKNLITRTEKQ